MFSIKKDHHTYSLTDGNLILVSSRYPIKPVHEGSSNFQVWVNEDTFVLYNVVKKNYLFGSNKDCARRYHRVLAYSVSTNSFVAEYHSPSVDKNLYNIVYDDGVNEVNYFEVGEDLGGYRIVLERVLNGTEYWNYFLEEHRTTLLNNSVRMHLGPRVHNYYTFHDVLRNKMALFYYSNYRSIFMNYLNAEKFIEIPDSKYFVGMDIVRTHRYEKIYYRIYCIHNRHIIVGTDELYTNYEFLPDIRCFKVETTDGWKFIRFNTELKGFEDIPYLGHYSFPHIKVIDSYLFIEDEQHTLDFVSLTDECNSSVWKTVEFMPGSNDSLQLTEFDGHKYGVSISQLNEEYIQTKEALQKNSDDIIEKYKQKQFAPRQAKTEGTKTKTYNETQPMELDQTLDFYCSYSGKINNDGIIVNSSSKIYDITTRGSIIAWVNFTDRSVYIVKADAYRCYRKIGEIQLTEDDWKILEQLNLPKCLTLGKECTISNFMDYMRKLAGAPSDIITDTDSTLSNPPTVEEPQLSGGEENDTNVDGTPVPSNQQSGEAFAVTIQNTYTYLLKIANRDKVMESLYVLFADSIQQLKGYHESVDHLLSELPSSDLYSLLTEKMIETAITPLPTEQKSMFKLSYDYHKNFQPGEIRDILTVTLHDCSVFSHQVEENLESILKEANASRAVNTKSNVMRILFYLIAQIKKTKETVKSNPVQVTLEGRNYSLHLNEKISRAAFGNIFKDYVRKADSLYIFIDSSVAAKLNQMEGYYELEGEGKDHHVSQTISNNANSDIAEGYKKLYLFQKINNVECSFFDQVEYVSHEEIDDPISANHRKVILFKLRSLLRK